MAVAAIAAGTASAGAISTLTIVQIGLGVASAVMMKKQAKKQQRAFQNSLNASSKIQSSTQVIQVPAKEHEIIYGLNVKTGGNVIFDHIPEDNKNYRYSVIGPCNHSIRWAQDLETGQHKLHINGEGFSVFSNRDGWNTVLNEDSSPSKYTDKFLFRSNFDATGIADQKLLEEIPDKWTINHKLTNLPYIILKLKYDPEVFQTFNLDLSFRVDGKEVFDPRNSLYKRTANIALCLLDYLKDQNVGMGYDDNDLDLQSFISAANISDQLINGIPRYEIHGKISSGQNHDEVLQSIINTCFGDLFPVGGKQKFYVGAYKSPVLEINENDLRSEVQRHNHKDKTDLINTIRGIYIDPVSGQPASYPTIKDEALIPKDNGELTLNLDFDLCNRTEQCQRVANMMLKRNRNEIIVSFSVSLKAINVHAIDSIYFSYEKYGWVNKVFEVIGFSLSTIDGGELVANLVLSETDPSIYDNVTTASYSQNKVTNIPRINDVKAPNNLVATEEIKNLGGVPQSWINLTWDEADSYYTKGYRVRYKKVNGEYISLGSFQNVSTSFVIKDSGDYIFEVQTENSKGLFSPYAQISKTITGYQTKPDDLIFNDCSFSKNFDISWSQDTKPYFKYSEIRLDSNFGVNDNNLLYRGVDQSLSLDGQTVAKVKGLRGITIYGKHFNTQDISSLNTTTKALSNTKPQAPIFTHKIDNNKVYFYIDKTNIQDDVLGFRLYKADTSNGNFSKVLEIDSFSSLLSFVIPFDSQEWDNKETITKYFKLSAFDILSQIKNDESQSMTNEIAIKFSYLDQKSLSVTSMADLRNIQLFRLNNWGFDNLSLLAEISFNSSTNYSQTLTLEKNKTYSISSKILGNAKLSFTSNSINYELNSSNQFQRFTTSQNDEDITFLISGSSNDSISEMMINEGNNSFAYMLHKDDEPINERTRETLNILTSQTGQILKSLNLLNKKVSDQGATISNQENEISLRVKKDKVLNEISLNEQGAKISGRNIVLDGFTRFINSTKITYGEIVKISGSIATLTIGSYKDLDTNGELFQDDSSFTYSNVSIDKDSGEITVNIDSGNVSLGFYSSSNIDTTSIDGGMIRSNSIYGDKIVSKSIGTDQLKAEQIFTDRLEINGYHNIVISGDDGLLIFNENAINTKTSTSSNHQELIIENHNLKVGDFIKILDGNFKGIAKKVTISDGNKIGFSPLESSFDSQNVKVKLFKKEGQDYTLISNGKIELVSSGTTKNYNDWSLISGSNKPQDNATNDSDKFTSNKLNVANAPEELKNSNVTAQGIGAETPQGAQTKANDAKNSAISTAATDAQNKANTAKNEAISQASGDATQKAINAQNNAISAAATDAENKSNTAKLQAIEAAELAIQKILDNNDPMSGTFINGNSIFSPIILGSAGLFSGVVKVGSFGNRIIIDGIANTIRSEDYVPNVSGWIIYGNGQAHFTNVSAVTRSLNYSEFSDGATHNNSGISFGSSSSSTVISINGDHDTNRKYETGIITCKNVSAANDFKKIITSFYFETGNWASQQTKSAKLTVVLRTKKQDGNYITQTIESSVLNLSSTVFIVDEIIETVPDIEIKNSFQAGRTIWVYTYVTLQSFSAGPSFTYHWKASSCNVQFEYLADTTNI